jgi:hypothetical protein
MRHATTLLFAVIVIFQKQYKTCQLPRMRHPPGYSPSAQSRPPVGRTMVFCDNSSAVSCAFSAIHRNSFMVSENQNQRYIGRPFVASSSTRAIDRHVFAVVNKSSTEGKTTEQPGPGDGPQAAASPWFPLAIFS